jgi:glyceraldehyde 3-phosphate dehydrogenase
MTLRVAINGFGRIGRLVLRAAYEAKRKDVEFVGINDLGSVEANAHLVKYDSVHGTFPGEVTAKGDTIDLGGGPIKVSAERDPAKLPWKSLGVDLVMECTGLFTARDKAAKHLEAGAKKVLISAPGEGADMTIVYGVNHQQLNNNHGIVSNASCTTNCLAPVAKVLHDAIGIERGFMTTIHAYTNDQVILDFPHKDLRRARAAAQNIIPTSTGAAAATSLVLPQLKGKLDGIAMRVPVPDGSVTDLVLELERETTVEEVNAAYKRAAEGPLKDVLVYTEDPIVSSDITGDPASCIFDSGLTKVIGNQVKVVAWYDNE